MSTRWFDNSHSGIWPLCLNATLVCGVAVITGCGETPPRFQPNLVYVRNQKLADELDDFQTELLQARVQDIERVLALVFGTPDTPRLPQLEDVHLDAILNLEMLRMAAGSREQSRPGAARGLFRDLCVRCHGLSGNGAGPQASGLDPYPRDYRRGIFKFKRTPSTLPPTNSDLHDLLVRGVPGTAMPSFRLLSEVEREALVQYVRYLSIRGLFERAIIEEAAFELDEDELLLDPKLQEISPSEYREQLELLNVIAKEVIQPWSDTEQTVIEVPPRPEDYNSPESIARGRELFFTTLTNCATCHGATALGDGQTEDYDEWSKELDPTNPEVLREYLALGALPPRKTRPRNLREGIYRGGYRAEDLFAKVQNGIAGTTMPNVAAQLTDVDIWHLVAFARYLPFDPISHPAPPPDPAETESLEPSH